MDEQDQQLNTPEEKVTTSEEEIVPEMVTKDEQPVTDIDEHKLYAAMSYLGVLVFVPLLLKKDDPFVQFHAKQGLVILIGFAIAFLFVNWLTILGNLMFIILLIASSIGLVQSLQGSRWKIPGIGDIADKFSV